LALKVASNPHPAQLSHNVREPLEAAHRDKSLADEPQKELTAAVQIDLIDRDKVRFVLLLAHAQSEFLYGTAMKRKHQFLVFGLVADEAH